MSNGRKKTEGPKLPVAEEPKSTLGREPRHRCCQCKRGIWPDRIAFGVSDRRTDLLACSVDCQREWLALHPKTQLRQTTRRVTEAQAKKRLPAVTETRAETKGDGQEFVVHVLPARKSPKRATDKRDARDKPHIQRHRREEREDISKEEGDQRRFAQQFVDQIVRLRRQGRTAEAAEIIDTLRLAKPHFAKIVTQEAKGRN